MSEMPTRAPRVTIGLPVFNGENFLEEALASIEAQEFTDFELLIGDNASTDRTEAICRELAARDPRVTYLRSDVNRGATWNYNRLVPPARGEYFIWMAHDDIFAPTLLSKSVALLDASPNAVLCCAGIQRIDPDGHKLGNWFMASTRSGKNPTLRFADVLRRPQWHQCFSLIRKSVLEDTRLFGAYGAADGVFLSELALRGQFAEVPEPLFFNREHQTRSTQAFPTAAERMAWWDPKLRGKITFPMWRLLKEYAVAVRLSPLSLGVRLQAFLELGSWAVTKRRPFTAELVREPWRYLRASR